MAVSGEEKKISTSELMASAKVVAEAAQSGFGKDLDKDKTAEAAGDLLDAVGQYAKLDDQKGVGSYVDKAADYLHKYENTTTATPPASKPADQPKSDEAAKPEGEGSGGIGGLGGDFAKVAGGFFK
uniref:Nodulin-related protein 1 n=1 Tax=Medicago truncatula TaxID=3880 RepID=I3SY58_MEDTR|nr:unknown [Medicago truncatula]